jgi:hypothetical protein
MEYRPPGREPAFTHAWVVHKYREDVWKALRSSLKNSSFTLQSVDEDTGILELSYKGDPEPYVDCGTISSAVRDDKGHRSYRFPAARERQRYEILDDKNRVGFADRRLRLDSRISVVLEGLARDRTRVTVKVHYGLMKTVTIRVPGSRTRHTESESVLFVSGERGRFDSGTLCQALGTLENEIFSTLADVLNLK